MMETMDVNYTRTTELKAEETTTVDEETVREMIIANINDLGFEGEVTFTAVREGLKHYDPDVLFTREDYTSAIRDCIYQISLAN